MQQNAFDLLKSGGIRFSQSQSQSQKQNKRRRSSADQQGAYTTCPVCNTSIPKNFADLHVASCLENQERQTLSQSRAGASSGTQRAKHAAKVPAAGGAAADKAAAPTPSSGQHSSEKDASITAEVPTAAHQQQPSKHTAANAKAATIDGALNAFAVMTKASASQVPLEAHMFLEACIDGSWVCHWWDEGHTPSKQGLEAAWSATVQVNMPKLEPPAVGAAGNSSSSSSKGALDIPSGSTKLKLQLSTNLPSGYGTAVNWSNPLLASNGHLEQRQQQQQQEHRQQQHHQQQQQQGRQHPAAAGSKEPSEKTGVRWQSDGLSVPISALQKCIRRGFAASATRIALLLLKEPKGTENLLRRLSIICLEDGLLHPQLPLVVWAMMAVSKGYVIGGSLANALLSITYQMAAVGHRDFLPDADTVTGPAAAIYQAPRTWQAVDAVLPACSSESLLVKTILIRAAYGGMDGDKAMMIRFAGLWLARFHGATLPPPAVPGPVEEAGAAAAAVAVQAQQQVAAQEQQQQQQQGPAAITLEQQAPVILQQQQQVTDRMPLEAASSAAQGQQQGLQQEKGHELQQQDPEVVLSPSPGAAAGAAAAAAGDERLGAVGNDKASGNAAASAGDIVKQRPQLTDETTAAAVEQEQQHEWKQLPGRRDPGASFDAAPAAVSPWVSFLRSAYQALPKPGPGQLATVTNVMTVGPLTRDDIPPAAIDFHVSNITDHLLKQQAVQDVLRDMVSKSTVLAARVQTGDGLAPLVNQTLWLHRSSLNRKGWLQDLYLAPEEWQKVESGSGYGRQVLEMEILGLRRFKEDVVRQRTELQQLWKVLAMRADAYSWDLIGRRVY